MKTFIKRSRGGLDLLIDTPDGERQVLASLSEMADADCWFVIDIRLLEQPVVHAYSGSGLGEDFCARLKPESQAEADFYLSKLKDVVIDDDGAILWCTYQNMWKGSQSVDGYTPPSRTKPAIYMTYAEGLQILNEIRAYWESYDGQIRDAKIPNANRQPRETRLRTMWYLHERGLGVSFEP